MLYIYLLCILYIIRITYNTYYIYNIFYVLRGVLRGVHRKARARVTTHRAPTASQDALTTNPGRGTFTTWLGGSYTGAA